MEQLSRRGFLRRGLALAAVGPLSGCALPPIAGRPAPKIPRVGYLVNASLAPDSPFRQGLRDLGYVEGETIVVEWRADEGQVERRAALAAELIQSGVDVIVATGDGRAMAARSVSSSVPIVLAPGNDPLGSGLARSFARPGGNVTGLVLAPPRQLAGKRLELLKASVPGLRRVAVLAHAADPGSAAELQESETAAPTLGLYLIRLAVSGADDFVYVLGSAADQQPQALLTKHSGFLQQRQQTIFDYAVRWRLPAKYGDRAYVAAGGLMSYGTDLAALFRRSAMYVDRLLRGTSPADLPIEQPTTFDFAINLTAARAIGLTLPEAILGQATEVFP